MLKQVTGAGLGAHLAFLEHYTAFEISLMWGMASFIVTVIIYVTLYLNIHCQNSNLKQIQAIQIFYSD